MPQIVLNMKIKKLLCLLMGMTMLFAAGCQNRPNSADQESVAPTEVVTAELGDTATYGGMTLTVNSVEDPDVILDNGKRVLLFDVTIANDTEGTVTASYLNNFFITVNGTSYDSDVCCSIPAMKVLYDTYSVEAINEELEPNASCSGYVACEVDKKYDLIDLHYIPKTTDRGSRITVSLTENDVKKKNE